MPKTTIDLSAALNSALPEDFVSFNLDLPGADDDAAVEINERRAMIENPEGLRYARAL